MLRETVVLMFVESLVETLQRRRILETFQEIFVTVAYASNAKNYIFTSHEQPPQKFQNSDFQSQFQF